MLKLPVISGKETIKKLEKAGYSVARQKAVMPDCGRHLPILL